jgi:hypothetical protein
VGAKKSVIQKLYFSQKKEVSLIQRSQLKVVKPKLRERKLRFGVNWQAILKQRGVIHLLNFYFRDFPLAHENYC